MSVDRVASWVRSALARVRVPEGGGGATRSLVEFDREPDPAWQAALTALAPLTDHQSGLAIHYETGDRWQPIHRWMIWQLQPWPYVAPMLRAELSGPSPRTNAQLVYKTRTIDGKNVLRPHIVGGPCRFVDRRTWALHQHYRAQGVLVHPRRFWVVQGADGGHPFSVDQSDEAYRLSCGLPGDVPAAGDLPYAPFDQRVTEAITAYDLSRWARGGDITTQAVASRVARWDAIERESNRLRYAERNASIEAHADELGHLLRKEGVHRLRWRPVGASARVSREDERQDAYITTTTWSDA